MRQIHTYQWRIASGVLVVLFIAGIVFGLLPYLSQTIERQQVLSSQQESIAFMSDWKGQQKELAEQKKILTEYVRSVKSSIPTQEEFPVVIEYLFRAARRAGIDIESMTPGKQSMEDLSLRSISIKSTGEYHAIATFINEIEQSNYVARISMLTIEQADVRGITAEFTLQFTMRGDDL